MIDSVRFVLPPIVKTLREETRDAHDRLDAANPLAEPGVDLPGYDALLARYLVAHRAVELALDPWTSSLAAWGVALDERRKVSLLQRDRAITASLLDTVNGEPPAIPFGLDSLDLAWGALYVVEGSTLGGQHILRLLEGSALVRSHGLTPKRGLSYFAGYGERTGDMWRRFLTTLGDAAAADPAGHDAIIEGARRTFALFECALTPHAPSPPFA